MAGTIYKCNACGGGYTEKTKRGHEKLFGHKSFTRTTSKSTKSVDNRNKKRGWL